MFDSFARQPGRRTVEGELLRVLRGAGAIKDPRTAGYEVASRTDAMVSAAWNVCAFNTRFDARRLAHVRHGVPGLWLLSAVQAPSEFSPRRDAASKRYVYHVFDTGLDLKAMREAAALFEGQQDFHSFCRPEAGIPTRRSLSRVRVEPGRLVFEAPNFLWEQVRRITHCLLAVGHGEQTLRQVQAKLAAGAPRDPEPPAAAQGLVLERVEVGLEFPQPSKAMRARVRAALAFAQARTGFYELFLASLPTVRR